MGKTQDRGLGTPPGPSSDPQVTGAADDDASALSLWDLVTPKPRLIQISKPEEELKPGMVVVTQHGEALLVMKVIASGGTAVVLEVMPLWSACMSGLLPRERFEQYIPVQCGVWEFITAGASETVEDMLQILQGKITTFALKIFTLPRDSSYFAAVYPRFVKEAALLQGMGGDPAFPAFFAFGEEPFSHILMQRFVGRTLANVLGADHQTRHHRKDGRLHWATVRKMVVGVFGAAERLHKAEIAHRDLKPQNIVLRELEGGDFLPGLLDLGLGRDVAHENVGEKSRRHTLFGGLGGTPGYMAPEQVLDPTNVGPPADVYALGRILAELLAGKFLFQHITPDTIHAHLRDEPPTVDHPELPSAANQILNELVARMCRFNPAERPPMATVRKQFRAAVGEQLRARGALR